MTWPKHKEERSEGIFLDPISTTLPDRVHDFRGTEVGGPFSDIEIHVGRTYESMSLKRYDLVPPGGNRFNLPDDLLYECWKRKRTGTTDVLGRLTWGAPSVTIRTEFFKPENGRYLHPEWEPDDPKNRQNRALTHREAARLQTFPGDFVWCGTKMQIARQIGNAVPPLLARIIAERAVMPLLAAGASDAAANEVVIAEQLTLLDRETVVVSHGEELAIPAAV